MKKFLIVLLVVTAACSEDNRKPSDANSMSIDSSTYKPKRLSDFIGDDKNYHWIHELPEGSPYTCELLFKDGFAIYKFSGQCHYKFLTNKRSDSTIDLLWSFSEDCVHSISFLKNPGTVKHPDSGEALASYTLINDTVLRATYHFPKLISKINRKAGDSLFPAILVLDTNIFY